MITESKSIGIPEPLARLGERFGTIGAKVGEYDVEVTTYRSDLYEEGSRHPEVRFGENHREVKRRMKAQELASGVVYPRK